MALTIPTLAEMNARGESAEVLFWVGCSGSFDDRAKRITKALELDDSTHSLPEQGEVPMRLLIDRVRRSALQAERR